MRGNWLFFLNYFTPTYLRLYWGLLRDGRVGLWSKLPVGLALAYLILPTDLIPDFFLAIGFADDALILVLSLLNLLRTSPPEVVEEHLRHITTRKKH
ncbi:YkvA family protein [Dethiosulfatarculus sandiegensis]|uniref:DUF1232 domain-containing protein n=1 Tax=Dethiosulfatarculus sandiegensis TaxID=1429043 RepID=A0A0D2JYZ6_9BACT|nr:DUF1232 domain-containing protein [Dethiosulfatarculus sandiegensis]KIX14780.1 hypothetical protein X474_06455 [Dethiosulfatarculus sandiegensis]